MKHYYLSPAHPRRPVDARYRRACEIVEARTGATPRDDAHTAKVVKFLYRQSRCRNELDLSQLQRKSPALFSAIEFHETAPASLIATLEARLLALEPLESIARKLCMKPAGVKAYRLTFFDVGERHTCLDFVMRQVIGYGRTSASDEGRHHALLKVLGYLAGWKALDRLLYPGFSVAAAAGNTSPQVLEDFRRESLKLKAALAVDGLDPADERDRRQLLRLVSQLQQEESQQSADNLSTLERHVAAMLSELPWMTGRDAESMLPPQVAGCDRAAAELRADEEMVLHAEGELPAEFADIQGLDLNQIRAQRPRDQELQPASEEPAAQPTPASPSQPSDGKSQATGMPT